MGSSKANGESARPPSRRVRAIVKSPGVLLGMLRFADLFIVFATAMIAYVLWHEEMPPENYYLAIFVGVLVTVQVFQFSGLYVFRLLDQPMRQMALIVPGLVGSGAILIALAFFTKESESYSRAWAGLWLAFAIASLLVLRIWVAIRLGRWRRMGLLTRMTLVVGAGDLGRRLVEHLRTSRDSGIEIAGIFDDRHSRIPGDIEGIPVLGDMDDLIAYTRNHPVDLIIIALPWAAEKRLTEVMNAIRTVPVDVLLSPDFIGFQLFDRGVTHLGGVPMLTVFERPLSGWNYLLKGVEDRFIALLVLLLFAPVMLAVAIAIKLTSAGPVLFRQKRYGFNNEVFEVYKFRTMYNRPVEDASVPQAKRGDPRITAVGGFLRRTSLDELPQLFNVMKGEMSIVGPRPHAVAHNEEFSKIIGQYYARHRVKPGITGWAQIHGYRGETDTPEKMAKRVQYDIYYIDNWSLLLDLRILVMTLFVGFINRNAY
jgi:Undecaprenyl-phosphate glucose phosphotransferase